MVARRLVPALLAFGLACLFLFAPVGINLFFPTHSFAAAPPLQGEPTPTPDPLPSPTPAPEVALDLTADQPQIEAGESVTYTVVITNTTNEVVGDVVLSSTLPPSTTFVADPNSPIEYDALTGAVIWNAGDISADTILTATYQIQASITATDISC